MIRKRRAKKVQRRRVKLPPLRKPQHKAGALSPGYSSNRLVFCCCGDVCYCMNAEDESLSFYQRIFFFIFIFFRRISSLIVFIFIYIFSQIAQNIVFIEYVFLSKSFVIEWINDIAGGLSLSEY